MAEIMFDGKPLRLTEWASCGGCAAKWGKDLLAGLVIITIAVATTRPLEFSLAIGHSTTGDSQPSTRSGNE